jgi:hypothetical protein
VEAKDLYQDAQGNTAIKDPYWDLAAKMPWPLRPLFQTSFVRTRYHSFVAGGRRAMLAWKCRLHREVDARAECLLATTVHVLEKMRDLARSRNIKFLALVQHDIYRDGVTVVPDADRFVFEVLDLLTPQLTFELDTVVRLLQRHGIPHLVLPVKMFRGRVPGDFHLSAAGTRVFGYTLEELTRDLIRK